jgi:hypothetical protein
MYNPSNFIIISKIGKNANFFQNFSVDNVLGKPFCYVFNCFEIIVKFVFDTLTEDINVS